MYHCTCQLVLDESIFAYLSAKVNVKKTDKEIKEKFSLSAYFIVHLYFAYATKRVIHIHNGAVITNIKMLKASVEVPVRTYC